MRKCKNDIFKSRHKLHLGIAVMFHSQSVLLRITSPDVIAKKSSKEMAQLHAFQWDLRSKTTVKICICQPLMI